MELPSTEGMQVHSGFDDCVGNTPLILLSSLSQATSCLIYGAKIFLLVEISTSTAVLHSNVNLSSNHL